MKPIRARSTTGPKGRVYRTLARNEETDNGRIFRHTPYPCRQNRRHNTITGCDTINNMQKIGIGGLLALVVVAAILMFNAEYDVISLASSYRMTSLGSGGEAITGDQFAKYIDVWIMLMLVAFLMIFIRKFEWGVCLATLLSAVVSMIVYLGIQDMYFHADWSMALLIRGVICAITLVIAIGVFLGTCKMWQYMLVGFGFAIVYALAEWLLGNVEIGGVTATDPGGSVLVHLCAAYFGLGVCIAIREKRAFDEPMTVTTHSVTFVWLASMLLWALWPSFVTSLLDDQLLINQGMMTCFMAGAGSIISAYAVCMICQKKINALTYTYAMLCGPVAIGAPLLSVGPWGALLIGVVAGAVSALCFIYLQPVFCKRLGVLDVMGVHNLHGIGGWMGAIFATVIIGSIATLALAAIVFVVAIVGGIIIGLIVRFTRGDMEEICNDETDFFTPSS